MKLIIKHQESYSRGQLLLRTFFGWLYIAIPHFFVLYLLQIVGSILMFISWWAILFTGKYPKSFFEFQAGVLQWTTRVMARILNLSDGYPPFGLNATDEHVSLEIPYPEKLSRGMLLLKSFFGFFYVLIPHGIILMFLCIGLYVVTIIAWFTILFAGKYPEGMHSFVVGIYRWGLRVSIYFIMTDTYPPFSLKEDEEPVAVV